MSYWKADPHRWGTGRTHQIHPDGTKTLCGVTLTNCPGQYVPENEYDCQGCAKVVAALEARRLWEEQWRIQQEQREHEQRERDRQREFDRGKTFMPFGMYQGTDVVDVPIPYLQWLLSQHWLFPDLRMNIENHLDHIREKEAG